MKSQDWAAIALCFLTLALLVASYSIAYAKGPKGGASIDVGTLHDIGALNNALPRLQPPAPNAVPMAPAMLAVPPGEVNSGVRAFNPDVNPLISATKKAEEDMEVAGSASSSPVKRAANTKAGQAAARAEARWQEAAADSAPASTVAKQVTILPTCN